MPKFGQVHFGRNYFGDSPYPTENWKRSMSGIPLGLWVRQQLAKTVIFRVRRGNGSAGATLGKRYQDKYKYVVPSSINNIESAPYRTQWKTAVDYWKNILSAADRADYNEQATHGLRISGFNLFMRKAMKGEIAMFTDRGDPATVDFDKDDLTIDGDWHELNLSSIVPSIARAVLLEVDIEAGHIDMEVIFKKVGNTNDINHTGAITKTNNKDQHKTCIVQLTSTRIINYKASVETWTTINISIRGWWT